MYACLDYWADLVGEDCNDPIRYWLMDNVFTITSRKETTYLTLITVNKDKYSISEVCIMNVTKVKFSKYKHTLKIITYIYLSYFQKRRYCH